jgi:hypothetical protein
MIFIEVAIRDFDKSSSVNTVRQYLAELFDDQVSKWHDAEGPTPPLHDFLGLNKHEYRLIVEDPAEIYAVVGRRVHLCKGSYNLGSECGDCYKCWYLDPKGPLLADDPERPEKISVSKDLLQAFVDLHEQVEASILNSDGPSLIDMLSDEQSSMWLKLQSLRNKLKKEMQCETS